MRALLNKIVTTNQEFESSFHRGSGEAQGNASGKLTLKFFGLHIFCELSVVYECFLFCSGRKFNCILYGVLYGVDCLTKVRQLYAIC